VYCDTRYYPQPFEPPDWRSQWVERMADARPRRPVARLHSPDSAAAVLGVHIAALMVSILDARRRPRRESFDVIAPDKSESCAAVA
jgi:hypothetical protein